MIKAAPPSATLNRRRLLGVATMAAAASQFGQFANTARAATLLTGVSDLGPLRQIDAGSLSVGYTE